MESIIEYKKSVQERLDNADLLVTKTVNLNAKLESELENKTNHFEENKSRFVNKMCTERRRFRSRQGFFFTYGAS